MMEPTWWMITGLVVGGLSLWLYMREKVLRLEAQVESYSVKRATDVVAAPPVKTRTVGEGASTKPVTPKSTASKPAEEETTAPPKDKAIQSEEPANDEDDSGSEEE